MVTQMPPSSLTELPLEEPARLHQGRSRWRRLVVAALGMVVILTVSYPIIANVLLRTRLLRNAINGPSLSFAIVGNTTALRLDYESAHSFFPGRVHLEGLTIRGRDRTAEWFLTLDHSDVDVSLVDLLHHRFHATRLRSDGLAIRARLRLHHLDATP